MERLRHRLFQGNTFAAREMERCISLISSSASYDLNTFVPMGTKKSVDVFEGDRVYTGVRKRQQKLRLEKKLSSRVCSATRT